MAAIAKKENGHKSAKSQQSHWLKPTKPQPWLPDPPVRNLIGYHYNGIDHIPDWSEVLGHIQDPRS